MFNSFVDVALEAVEFQAEGYIFENAHRKGVRLLEDHSNMSSHDDRIDAFCVDVLAVKIHLPLEPEAPDEIVHAVEAAEHSALAAAGRSDETRDLALLDRNVAIPDRKKLAVEDFVRLAVNYDVRR